MTTHPLTRLTIPVAVAAIVILIASASGQESTSRRTVVLDPAYSAIDRGVRDNDPPGAPRSATAPGGRGGQYMPDSLIVKFRTDASPETRTAALSAVRGTVTTALPWADFNIISVASNVDPRDAALELGTRPDVEYAQPRYRVRPLLVPNDPLYSRQWNFSAIDMERAWDINPGATSNIVVAVIDTGVAYRNATVSFTGIGVAGLPALGEVTVPFAAAPELGAAARFVSPFDFIWNDDTPIDLNGHGTHIAGTIGQLTNNNIGVAGMAFNVRIMPVKVLDTEWDEIFNSPNVGTDDVVARGIRYAADHGAAVINLSLGRDGGPAPAVRAAVEYAVRQGSFVVTAGGNEFEDGNRPNRLAEFAPQIDGMVAVGAIGPDRSRAYYSSTGSHIELVAPGGDQRRNGTGGGVLQQTYDLDMVDRFSQGLGRFGPPRFDAFVYEYFQGTSMATAHVSGFAALLMQQGITNSAAVEAVMKRYATDLGAAGRDNEHGHGLINPRAALRGMGLIR